MTTPDTGERVIIAGDPGCGAKLEALLNCPIHGEPYTELQEEFDTALIESDQPKESGDPADALPTLMGITGRMEEVATAHSAECPNES